MLRNVILVFIAFCIDGLQAVIAWGLTAIATMPGTIGGGAVGAAVGSEVAGEVGATLGGALLATLGTFLNPALVLLTVPVGIGVSLAVNTAITLVLGYGFLCFLLLFCGLKPHKRLWWSGAELIPGLNNIPCWTFFTISCIWAESTGMKSRKGLLGIVGLTLAPVRGIMRVKENTPGNESPNNIPQPESARELIRASEKQFPERAPMRDIRPSKSNAKTA